MSRNALLVLLATWLVLVVESNVILWDENAVDGEIDLSDLRLELYGEPDKQVGELVDNYDPDKDGVNLEELGSYVGGDMLINRPGGVVPFEINGNFDDGKTVIDNLLSQFGTDANTSIPVSNVGTPAEANKPGGGFSLFINKHRKLADRLIEVFVGPRNIELSKPVSASSTGSESGGS